jgi:hypothetical protein
VHCPTFSPTPIGAAFYARLVPVISLGIYAFSSALLAAVSRQPKV